ncbi:hypothetical protein L505_3662 [Bordetella bronchiseptica F4563]|nr:hypothetical protein L505_3662 [Bordetella bronchiseptica F4563]
MTVPVNGPGSPIMTAGSTRIGFGLRFRLRGAGIPFALR